MREINTVVIIGRLTREPEYKTVNEKTVASFAIANGNGKDDGTDFFDVCYWGKGAEAVRPYLAKGSQILVQGRLRQNRWEKDGKTQSRVDILAESIQLCGSKTAKKEEPEQNDFNDGEDIPF